MRKHKETRRALRLKGVCTKSGLGRSTIYALIAAGKFPAGFHLTPGGRAKGWYEDLIDDYLAAQSEGEKS